MRTPRFVAGEPFTTTLDAVKWIAHRRPVYSRGKFIHGAWAVNWSLHLIVGLASRNALRPAYEVVIPREKKEEELP